MELKFENLYMGSCQTCGADGVVLTDLKPTKYMKTNDNKGRYYLSGKQKCTDDCSMNGRPYVAKVFGNGARKYG